MWLLWRHYLRCDKGEFYGKCEYVVVVWQSSTYTIGKFIKIFKKCPQRILGVLFMIIIIYFYLFIYLFIYLFLLAVSTPSGLESCSYSYLFASVGR